VPILALVCVGVFLGIKDESIVAQTARSDDHLFVEETYLLKNRRDK
jgi:hypothetical protein